MLLLSSLFVSFSSCLIPPSLIFSWLLDIVEKHLFEFCNKWLKVEISQLKKNNNFKTFNKNHNL